MKGFPYSCAATAAFGLESVVRAEVERLGIPVTGVEDRRVQFQAGPAEVARCNLWLRSADRVLLQLARFPAAHFDVLYEGVRALPWQDLLGRAPAVTVEAVSVRSVLTAVPRLQSIGKKAIVDALNPRGGTLAETGPSAAVRLSLQRDIATVSLDTTGPGLHKRGYRGQRGEAPLRENLAAGLILLSRWRPPRPFADPLCGSGTIAIEAALLASNRAPGLTRRFAAEDWPSFPPSAWQEERASAADAQRYDMGRMIEASDIDPAAVAAAQQNAKAAGVQQMIGFRSCAVRALAPEGEHGCLVCNPPYGERLGSHEDARAIVRDLGQLRRRLPTWSFFVLSAREDFPRSFGQPASRNRKLYNGNLRCWLYQYFGPLP